MFQPLLMTKTNVLLVMYGDINDSSSFGSLVICNIQCIPIIQGSGRQQKTDWDGQVLKKRQSPELCCSLHGQGDESWWHFRENTAMSVPLAPNVVPNGEGEPKQKSHPISETQGFLPEMKQEV